LTSGALVLHVSSDCQHLISRTANNQLTVRIGGSFPLYRVALEYDVEEITVYDTAKNPSVML